MTITDFDRIRAGSHYPVCIDIGKIGLHESHGVLASARFIRCDMPGEKDAHRVEVRVMDGSVYLLVYRWEDMEPPKWLEQSQVIWESHMAHPAPKDSPK